jgi:hypothetical protein
MSMPQRRLAGLAVALLAPAALAACSITIDPSSMPAPFSQAPVPSASTGQPAYVCTAVYQILTSGAARLSSYVGGDSEAARKNMQSILATMATQVSAEGTESTDPQLTAAIDDIATDLTTASKQPDPATYINGGFTTVGQKMDGLCT